MTVSWAVLVGTLPDLVGFLSERWSDPESPRPPSELPDFSYTGPELHAQITYFVVAAGGLAIIGLIASANRRPVVGAVYLTLAGLIGSVGFCWLVPSYS